MKLLRNPKLVRPVQFCAAMLIVLALLTSACADDLILTGNAAGLWIVQLDASANTFNIFHKTPDAQWERLTQTPESGSPTAAAAIGSQLNLFQTNPPGYLIYNPAGGIASPATMPRDARWLAGQAPLAVCEARGLDQSQDNMLAVVPGPSAMTATIQAASSKPAGLASRTASTEPLSIGVFMNRGQWTHLTDLPVKLSKPAGKVFCAVAGGTLYVLTLDEAGNAHLRRWKQAWEDVSLAKAFSSAMRPVAMAAREQYLLILLAYGGDKSDKARVSICAINTAAASPDGISTLQEVTTADGKVAQFDAAELPRFAVMGDKVALAWREENAWQWALCDWQSGAMMFQEPLEILVQPSKPTGGLKILQTFDFAVIVLTLIAMSMLRSKVPPAPFSLPSHIRRGNLFKRLAAAFIDMFPFFIISSVTFMPHTMPQQPLRTYAELKVLIEQNMDSVPAAYSAVLMMSAYTAYCVLMEWRFGATLGKRLMKLRVVTINAATADFKPVLVRNLWRVIELTNVPFQVLMLIMLLVTRYHQRLGDMMAKTSVVDARTLSIPPLPMPPQDPDGEKE